MKLEINVVVIRVLWDVTQHMMINRHLSTKRIMLQATRWWPKISCPRSPIYSAPSHNLDSNYPHIPCFICITSNIHAATGSSPCL